jgi:hypothetical protein
MSHPQLQPHQNSIVVQASTCEKGQAQACATNPPLSPLEHFTAQCRPDIKPLSGFMVLLPNDREFAKTQLTFQFKGAVMAAKAKRSAKKSSKGAAKRGGSKPAAKKSGSKRGSAMSKFKSSASSARRKVGAARGAITKKVKSASTKLRAAGRKARTKTSGMMNNMKEVASTVTNVVAGAAGAVAGTVQAATQGNQPSSSNTGDSGMGGGSPMGNAPSEMSDDTGSDMEQ